MNINDPQHKATAREMLALYTVLEAFKALPKIRGALEESNGLLRAARSIATRRGKNTHWDGLVEKIDAALIRQHWLLHPKK